MNVEFRDTEDVLEVYSEDASRWYRVKPRGVFFPRSTEDVVRVVDFCRARGFPLTPRGGGSGLAGGAVPSEGGFVISLEKMDAFRVEDGVVLSQAGAISGQIERALGRIGYTMPAHPSSLNFSTIGGNVATNSAGLRALKYGSIKEHVLELEVVLPDGSVRVFRGEDSGVFVGCEGTLGVITYVVLRAFRKKRRTQYVIFTPTTQILNIFWSIRDLEPSAFEILDDLASYIAFGERVFCAIVEFEEDFPGIFAEVSRRFGVLSRELDVRFVELPDVWERRKRIGPALSKLRPFKINEDVVIPISRLERYLDFILRVREKISCVAFGHLGSGIIHTNIMFGGGEEKTALEIKREIFEFVLELGGSVTGEHGTGVDKIGFIERELGEGTVELIRMIKRHLDPADILNPSKIPRSKKGCIDTEIRRRAPQSS